MLHIRPTAVRDIATGYLFVRVSTRAPLHPAGMQSFRRAARLLPGVWWSYGTHLADWPGNFEAA